MGKERNVPGNDEVGVMFIEKLIVAKRFIQSVVILWVYLCLPTMWLRSRFALAIARFPVWKQYDFFAAMFRIIAEEKGGKKSNG